MELRFKKEAFFQIFIALSGTGKIKTAGGVCP